MPGHGEENMRKFAAPVAMLLMAACCMTAYAGGNEVNTGEKKVTIYFTHDIHSYLEPASKGDGDEEVIHGGGARLATALLADGYSENENALYLDGGDFSQGTLFQSGYEEEAFELRLLGKLGAVAVTPGNHEWDHGGEGLAKMLESAMASGDPLPYLTIANIDFTGELTEEQQKVKDTLTAYAEKTSESGEFRYRILTLPNGVRVGLFGVSGESSIEDSPTSGMKWTDKTEAAKEITGILQPQCDLIVCLSHSGTAGAESGEDIDLAKAVPGIDFILSGHSHTMFKDAVTVGTTVIGCTGEYLENLGKVEFTVGEDGTVSLSGYELIPIDDSLPDDPEIREYLDSCKGWISKNYLEQYKASFDDVVCESSFNMISLSDMYGSHQEYTVGDLIADSYIYEARKNGIDDIDVALVGLGTIRGSISDGPVTLSDAFEICSLGMGEDGSAGHPLIGAYITGKELKLLTELDASLGPMVSSIKMSYSGVMPDGSGSGLSYTFNEKRMLLDRVTDVCLIKDGKRYVIEDDKLYKVCCNMYAANMLGMLNGLTKGVLSITPKNADGSPVTDFYDNSLLTADGSEIKEWVAFKDYLESFPDTNGNEIPDLPESYADQLGRKVKVSEGGLSRVKDPGATTMAVCCLGMAVVALLTFGAERIFRKKKKKK